MSNQILPSSECSHKKSTWDIGALYNNPLSLKMIGTLKQCYEMQKAGEAFDRMGFRLIDLRRRDMIGKRTRAEYTDNTKQGWLYVTARGIEYLKKQEAL